MKRTCKTCELEFDAESQTVINCRPCREKIQAESRSKALEERRMKRLKRKEDKRLDRAARNRKASRRRLEEKRRAKEEVLSTRRAREQITTQRKKVNLVRRELAARALAKKRLLPFIVRNVPGYKAGWLHKDIARRLEKFSQAVAEGKSPRMILNVPPRHGKSEIGSCQFPAWHLGHHPEHEVICCSHTASLAEDFSKKTRALMEDPLYKSVFGEVIDKDNRNSTGWKTRKRGGYLPAGVGGPILGKGAHVLIIDDPHKNFEEAYSEPARTNIKNWYRSTAYSRLAPGGGVLIIMQRWHFDDLSGWQIKQMEDATGEEWEVITYPAEAEEPEPYRRVGDALHEERYPKDALERIKRSVGPQIWSALYQQQPVASEGDYFVRDMFENRYSSPPQRLNVYAAWDFAIGKQETNDYTVGAVIGVDDNDDLYLLEIVRGRWDADQIISKMFDVHRRHGVLMHGIERGHITMAMEPFLEKRIDDEKLYDFQYKSLPTGRRDKQARARSIQGLFRRGKVKLPHAAPWLAEFELELLQFPAGKHDDMVDAVAWIGIMLQELALPTLPPDPDIYGQGWRQRLAAIVGGGSRTPMGA